jgi:predicted nucleic acid-binding protein
VNGWLLDTNILSELRRPKPQPKVVSFIASKPLDLLCISSATLAEIASVSSSSCIQRAAPS